MSETEKIQNLKTVVIYSMLGIGTASGLFLLGRHFIKKSQANRSEKKALDEGDPSTFAKQLKMAFENDNYLGWGTNVELVNQVFQEIPSKKMYARVQNEYMKMYNKSLNADLEDEMSSDEYNALIRVLSAKK
jgi:hypothetical protein